MLQRPNRQQARSPESVTVTRSTTPFQLLRITIQHQAKANSEVLVFSPIYTSRGHHPSAISRAASSWPPPRRSPPPAPWPPSCPPPPPPARSSPSPSEPENARTQINPP
jgi:hypothetical protein